MNAGAIEIDYSNTGGFVANKAINGATLFLVPYLSANNDIVWRCGQAPQPTSASLDPSVTFTASTVSVQYLPGACHG